MELRIERVAEDEAIPVAHRQNGAQTSALVEQLVAFGQSAANGERFKVDTENVLVFKNALRLAATELDTGVRIREVLSEPGKTTQNRKGEDVLDLKQPGTVYFWFANKREVKPGSAKPGRKPAAKK